ncbi:McrC family protein [Hymenobacter sp. BT730]|uniref:McrC family protein n=1 Tax=Hymenobacter sp. BT730 TaxID=3063332 RepID=UPI0026E003B6|nr:restriction endonuclease [Hymenobacter sp. BT730]
MPKIMRVLEHSTLRIGAEQQGLTFEKRHWKQLFQYHDEHAAHRYYDMRHDGVRFRSYVGVIQAGDITIEILPKVDDVEEASDSTMMKWRDILLRMLHESGTLKLDSLSNAFLHEKENSLLDIYLELFLNEVEKLLHRGLVKRYRYTEGQQAALRGALQFGKQISLNLIHQERFYTRHQTYDHQHLHNQLIRQALLLLPRLTNSSTLRGRTARALLQWADAPTIKVTAATFARLTYDRKTEDYRPALIIARLLLLHHRPDLRGGNNDMVALLFNMNQLWEKYLLRTLYRLSSPYDCTVVKPSYRILWVAENETTSKMQPDILITVPGKGNIVLDAKWKRPKGRPSEADLRQLYTYAQYYDAAHAVLLYPHTDDESAVSGKFQQPEHLPACNPEDLILCSTVFVQIGNGNSLGAVGDCDSLGYLRCTLESEFKNWLGYGSHL